jgi:hypothetical protein
MPDLYTPSCKLTKKYVPDLPADMVEYLSTEKPIHTQEKRVDDFHRAFG